MDLLDRRVLGAIEFVDAVTAARLRAPLKVEPADAGVDIRANRSSLYVIHRAPGLESHLDQFEKMPTTPTFGAREFEIRVRDPGRRYLPRGLRIALPRLDAPASDARSVLNPLVVPMFPAASAAVNPRWAVLRVHVQGSAGRKPGLGNVLVKVTPQVAGLPAVSAMTDERGEALVAIAGAQPILAQGAAPALLTRTFACNVDVVVDRRVVIAAPAPPAAPAAAAAAAAELPLADPDVIERDRLAGVADVTLIAQSPVSLSAGQSLRATVEIPWP